MTRSCCVCGARVDLVRYRYAELPGGPRQYVCRDTRGCAERDHARAAGARPNG